MSYLSARVVKNRIRGIREGIIRLFSIPKILKYKNTKISEKILEIDRQIILGEKNSLPSRNLCTCRLDIPSRMREQRHDTSTSCHLYSTCSSISELENGKHFKPTCHAQVFKPVKISLREENICNSIKTS